MSLPHTLFLSVSSTFSLQEGRRSSSSGLVGDSGFGLDEGEDGVVVGVPCVVGVDTVRVEDGDSLDSGLDVCGWQERISNL